MRINITTNTTSKEYDLESFNKDVVSFGRSSECDIQIEAAFVSRVHGCFYFENGSWKVQDLESRNGIYKNGKKILSSPLRDGETIEIRNTKRPSETIRIIASKVVDKNKADSSKKREKKNKDSKAIIFVVLGVGVAVLVLVVVLVAVFAKKRTVGPGGPSGPGSSTATDAEDYYENEEDAEAYYNENSTVVSVTDAGSSSTVMTEKTAVSEMNDRGFEEYVVESDYDMNGELLDDPVMDESSSDKHPMYSTSYYNSSEELWVIYFVNDRVMAFPVSYNDQSDRIAPVMITENDTVMSYDCYSNKYYETIPNESELIVVNISNINDGKISGGKINTDILDALTIEEIDHYVDK